MQIGLTAPQVTRYSQIAPPPGANPKLKGSRKALLVAAYFFILSAGFGVRWKRRFQRRHTRVHRPRQKGRPSQTKRALLNGRSYARSPQPGEIASRKRNRQQPGCFVQCQWPARRAQQFHARWRRHQRLRQQPGFSNQVMQPNRPSSQQFKVETNN